MSIFDVTFEDESVLHFSAEDDKLVVYIEVEEEALVQ